MVKDRVFPPDGLTASWTAPDGAALIDITVADPAYDYTHELPFPRDTGAPQEVDRFFGEMISRAASHLAG
jgi:hypothetical protein